MRWNCSHGLAVGRVSGVDEEWPKLCVAFGCGASIFRPGYGTAEREGVPLASLATDELLKVVDKSDCDVLPGGDIVDVGAEQGVIHQPNGLAIEDLLSLSDRQNGAIR